MGVYDCLSKDVAEFNDVAESILLCAGGDERIFNSPVSFMDQCPDQEQQEISTRPPYSRLA